MGRGEGGVGMMRERGEDESAFVGEEEVEDDLI